MIERGLSSGPLRFCVVWLALVGCESDEPFVPWYQEKEQREGSDFQLDEAVITRSFANSHRIAWNPALVRLQDGRVLMIDHDGSEVYDPHADRWNETAIWKNPRGGQTAVLLEDGRVMSLGGYSNPEAFDLVRVYNPKTDTWSKLAPMNSPRAAARATQLPNDRILVVGGVTEKEVARVEVYDVKSDTWTPLWHQGLSPSGFSLTALPDRSALMIGGCNDHWLATPQTAVRRFNPETSRWESCRPLPEPRTSHHAVRHGKEVWVFGGLSSDLELSPKVLAYDIEEDTWREGPSLQSGRSGGAFAIANEGHWVLCGGFIFPLGYGCEFANDTAEVLEDGEWHPLDFPAPRIGHGITCLEDGSFLLVGGGMSIHHPAQQSCRFRLRGLD